MVAGNARSISARIFRASAGAVPAVEMATVIGPRSTIAGMMKLESFGRSTTFTGTQRRWASCDTRTCNAPSSVATMTSVMPSRSAGSKS